MTDYEDYNNLAFPPQELSEVDILREENKRLKELLKECREILDYAKDFAYHNPCCKCIAKIDKAIGEK